MNRKQTAVFAVAVLVCAVGVGAGIVTPPIGPVTPTDRTQIDAQYITVLPYTITEPGSYVLTSNLFAEQSQDGIHIEVSNVTIDLNGFTIFGVSEDGTENGSTGIEVTVPIEGLTILNGEIRDWTNFGIDAEDATHCSLQNLRIIGNGFTGASIGPDGLVADCLAAGNEGNGGIQVAENCTIRNCTAYYNVDDGFHTGDGCTVVECVAEGNGERGFILGEACVVTDCTASLNGNSGISGASTVDNCVANSNGGTGITGRGTISNSVSVDNGDGLSIHSGFFLSSGTISGCTAIGNSHYGISVSQDALVINNKCADNGDTGIRVSSARVRIQGNDVVNNSSGTTLQQQYGIRISFSDNIILQNTAHGNVTANYEFGLGPNSWGPIIDVSLGGDITGYPGSEHPWANFEY